jgi:hypothetical protein
LLVLRMASCPAIDEGGLSVFTRNMASCHFRLANTVCWCCAWHPALPSTRAGSLDTEASLRRLGAAGIPSSQTLSPSRRSERSVSRESDRCVSPTGA